MLLAASGSAVLLNGSIVVFFDTRVDTILDKEMLLPQAEFQFENRKYTGFANYDYVLSRAYGNYMQLPPEEKRITHDFDVWWKE